MSESRRPRRFEPAESELTQAFWDGTRERRLVLQWCNACEQPVHYPRECCPKCMSADQLGWRPSEGRGEVYAYSVMHRAGSPFMADRVPYVVALVQLDDGARLMTNIVGCAPSAVRVGMPVSVTWEELSDGRALPQFEPRPGA